MLGEKRVQSFDLRNALAESRAYLAHLRSQVSHYVIGDQQAFDFFTFNGIPECKIIRIPQALPNDALMQRPRAKGRPVIDRPLRIGFVGRLDPDKGFHILAHAFDSSPENAPIELWVIDKTAATEETMVRKFPSVKRLRSWLASGRVRLFRPTKPEELYQLMANVDLGVIPSIQYEAPCAVMLEMVAQKTPIVRSESKGMEHVIQDSINGRTFPYGDASALAGILEEILNKPDMLVNWQNRLPEISSDVEYGLRLVELFRTVISKSESLS
jgi:glycosyltransferase involved in cell wall biosynthesis